MTTESASPKPAATSMRGLYSRAVHLPGDSGYDDARMPWNVAVDQRPAAVVFPAEADDIAEVVRAAAATGLRVAAQGTGHNAAPLGPLDDAVLLRTSSMTAVSVDPSARTARVEAGALWLDVVEAAAGHGLAALHGSSPDVGVVGYSLGGGIGWYARHLGLQTNSITAAELVTADGSLVRIDTDTDPELFWALRGGGGNFGIVTALEFQLYPYDTAYGGMLVWDWNHSERVLREWAPWSVAAPDAVTTSFRVLNVPPLPDIPEVFRGRQLAVVDGAVLDTDERAESILAPLRALRPEMDTFERVPTAGLARLHMDPEGPTPFVSDSSMLAGLPSAGIDAFLSQVGPGSGSSLLMGELRQLGGALGRPHPGAGALPMLDGQFVLAGITIAATPEMGATGMADATRLVEAMAPYSNGGQYLNFAEAPVDPSRAFDDATWQRLKAIRSAVDPDGLFMANHQVPRLVDDEPATS